MKKTLTVAAIAVLVALIGFESFLFIRHASAPKREDASSAFWSSKFSKERAHWQDEIDKLGTQKAYELFKEDTLGKDFGTAHTLAHLFGELIYEKDGLKGIAVCDASFAFGCYHSFFGKAITNHGIEVVSELDKSCVEKWGPIGLGCPHGIGHGILAYLGDGKLDQALEICSKLSWKGIFGGCQSGVFMEYNFRTMQSIEGVEPRQFDPQHPLSPCDAVPKAFSQSCYFELAAWIANGLSNNYAEAGKVCAKAPDSLDRKACFLGIGDSAAPNSQYNIDKSVAACANMPSRKDLVDCRAGTAWAFFAEPSAQSKRELLCKGLSASEEKVCLSESQLITYEKE